MRLCRLIFSIAAVILLSMTSAMAERRVALVVGNSAYRNAPSLTNPKNDAGAIAAALQRLGFEVIQGIDLTADKTRQTLRTFATALKSADVALFYYAGHGLQVDGQNYLVPVDARLQSSLDLEFEATKLQVVIETMERAAKTSLVFLDACRDNPLKQTLARSLGANRSVAVGQGLARVDSGVGTLIAYATEPGNVALDGAGAHSPFTAALLANIERPGLEVGRMLRRVRSTVVENTKGKQVPWDHSSLIDDFYFAHAPATEAPPASVRPSPQLVSTGSPAFLTKAQIMETVIGNTLNFRSPRNGEDVSVYFAEDGTVDIAASNKPRTFHKVWFINKLAMLCRTAMQNRKHCVNVARGDGPDTLELSNPIGINYSATILKGRQLPELHSWRW